MNRTAEAIKKSPFKDDILHEHIARTYFHQRTRKKKAKTSQKDLRLLLMLAASILAVVVFGILAISLADRYYIKYLKQKTDSSTIVTILEKGEVNKTIVKRVEFSRYAKAKSKISRDVITLSNPMRYRWTSLSMDFRFPIDFSERKVSLELKGRTGGEKVNIAFKDAHNRSSRFTNISLTPNWKNSFLYLAVLKGDIDISKITHFRLECDYAVEPAKEDSSPASDVTVYIKDVRLSKEAKI